MSNNGKLEPQVVRTKATPASEGICPKCGQELPDELIEELNTTFTGKHDECGAVLGKAGELIVLLG